MAWPANPASFPPAANLYRIEIANAAEKYALAPQVVCAVVEQESAFDTWALRFEPAFLDRYVPANLRDLGEGWARACSWGLMQVMGQVAREHGFIGKYLTELCDPMAGLDVGCKVLRKKLALDDQDIRVGLQAWNGGWNQNYAAEVIARIPKFV